MNLRDISVLKMQEQVYDFAMKMCLWIIATTIAISTNLLATPLNVSVADNQTGNTITSSYMDDKLGFGSSEYLTASISKASLGTSFSTQNDENSIGLSTPYMNRPGGSYTHPLDIPGVPDGGLTALLLSFGMAGLILLARRDAVVRKNN